MNKLFIAFLWHMHQPFYKDELTGRYYLPWVRLHATKGYTDLPALLEGFPKIRQTFNLTPSLLFQLKDYAENNVDEDMLRLSRRPAQDLTHEEKGFILANFFMNNWPNVVKPHLRYSELLAKRGLFFLKEDMKKKIKQFSDSDFRDLQVLFNLLWFGYTWQKKEPLLRELLLKGKNYTEEDKAHLLEIQLSAVKEVVPLYRRLCDAGSVELITSPFFHPILPIFTNKKMDWAYHWQEDASWQIREGIHFAETVLGYRPRGLWPSEGAVSQDALSYFLSEGVEWMASDEEILLRSHGSNHEPISSGGRKREEIVFKPYFYQEDGKRLSLIFRDRRLSDLIGFSYSSVEPQTACDDFMKRLEEIRTGASERVENPLVAIILDGENAWEHYRDGGEKFLSLLYQRLSDDHRFETVTLSNYLNRFPPKNEISKIHAGSWINHDFSIWFGHEEDRSAWNLLDKTRTYLVTQKGNQNDLAKAWREIYIAEGSDWFWWFGDEFSSATDEIFDFLFRNHLMNVYRILGKRIPSELKNPIKKFGKTKAKVEPVGFIDPVLDGQETSFYEWSNAGYYDVDEPSVAMQRSEKFLRRIYYGFNLGTLFLRLDLIKDEQAQEETSLIGVFHMTTPRKDFFADLSPADSKSLVLFEFEGETQIKKKLLENAVSIGKIAEIKIPFADLEVSSGDEINFSFLIHTQSGIKVEEWPKKGLLSFKVPDEGFESLMWSA